MKLYTPIVFAYNPVVELDCLLLITGNLPEMSDIAFIYRIIEMHMKLDSKRYSLLFLCTGNSVCNIMADALLNNHAQDS